MKNAIIIKDNYELSSVKQMTEMSTILKEHIIKQKLYTNIQGKNYVHTDGWQFAGGLMGLYPRMVKVENLSNDKEIKWLAEVEIIRISDDKVVGGGFAICSNKEGKKAKFDEYAILSMAQTRCVGKAYRNLVGWVIKTAGYESTPSEEMTGKQFTSPSAPRTAPAPAPKQAKPTSMATKNKQTLECHECAAIITKPVHDFSKRMYKKSLCRDCQPNKK